MKTYFEFCEAIKQRESSGDYGCKNAFGFLGAYQFGMARLCDLGFAIRKNSLSTSMDNKDFNFIPPLSEEKFLTDPLLQDCLFWIHTQKWKNIITNAVMNGAFSLPTSIKENQVDMSGAIAACHLNGYGSLRKLLINRIDEGDGFGTLTSEYLIKFSGYIIP